MIGIDVYRCVMDRSFAITVKAGHRLPPKVARKESELMPHGNSDIPADVVMDDVRERGFCFFRAAEPEVKAAGKVHL